MRNKIRKIYIGVAWPYVNSVFHIGNLAGAYLPPDIFSRFHKLKGDRVLMVSGSDFHGTPITVEAEKEGKKPIEVARRFDRLDKYYLERIDIDYTLYTSTHTKNHFRVVQDLFLKLLKRGYIKILKTEQLYSEKSKRFLQDRYIEGECPYCHFKKARGDQCEACGRILEATELINPVSKIDGSRLVKRETENYFLDLPRLQEGIKKWLLKKKDMRGWVKKEALGWIREGLRPRAITRDLSWGIPLPIRRIPKNLRIKNIRKKVFYVWFEAVIGYLSGAIEYSRKKGRVNYWKEFFYNQGETYYFVGQDNLAFHTITWPAELLAFDKKINLPENVFVNKFVLLEGRKMSKSRKWFIETPYLVENYPIDSIRFYLAFNMPEEKELNFKWEEFIEDNNRLLVAKIGNLIHRVLTLCRARLGRKFKIKKSEVGSEIRSRIEAAFSKTSEGLEKGRFRASLFKILELADFANSFIDRKKIWQLARDNPQKAEEVLSDLIYLISSLRILLFPFLPSGSERLSEALGEGKIESREGINKWRPEEAVEIKLASHISPLFKKIDQKRISIEVGKLGLGQKPE